MNSSQDRDGVSGEDKPMAATPIPTRKTTSSTASDTDVLTLNIGGSHTTQVLRSTLTFVENSHLANLFSGRWDHDLARDAQGNFFVDEDPTVFLPLLHYLRDISRQSPLAAELDAPTFQDTYLEQRFRLAVDHYGLTDAFYPVVLFERLARTNVVVSRDVLHWNMDDAAPTPTSDGVHKYSIDLLKRKIEQRCNESSVGIPFERKFHAYEVTLGNLLQGFAKIGWKQRGPSTDFALVPFFMTATSLRRNVPAMSFCDRFDRNGHVSHELPDITWMVDQVATIWCSKQADGHLQWSVNGRLVAQTMTHARVTDPATQPRVVEIEWTPGPDENELIPYIEIKRGCHLRFSAMELEF
jgi:hypothetical protein